MRPANRANGPGSCPHHPRRHAATARRRAAGLVAPAFQPGAGGGGALVGISWLVPVFGAWFGWKLAASGGRPGSAWRALGLTVLALAALPASGFAAARLGVEATSVTALVVYAVVSVAALLLALLAWPRSAGPSSPTASPRASRSFLVMLAAILGSWAPTTTRCLPGPRDVGAPEVAGRRVSSRS